jgi:hypothetical protein
MPAFHRHLLPSHLKLYLLFHLLWSPPAPLRLSPQQHLLLMLMIPRANPTALMMMMMMTTAVLLVSVVAHHLPPLR